MKKAQNSFEFLSTFVIGFTLVLVMAGVFLAFSGGAKENLDSQQISKIGNDIMKNVEEVYFFGNGNRLAYKTKFPSGISNFTITHYNDTVNDAEDYDSLNITLVGNNGIYRDVLFHPPKEYIRFNCTSCYMVQVTDNLSVSYYNESDFSEGTKHIRIESKGDWVSIDFVTG